MFGSGMDSILLKSGSGLFQMVLWQLGSGRVWVRFTLGRVKFGSTFGFRSGTNWVD